MNGPNHPNVARQKEFQQISFEYLSKALTIDETETTLEEKCKAVFYYEKGVEALRLGVGLYLPEAYRDPALVRAHSLRDKMKGNLSTAEERCNFLKTSSRLDSLSLRTDNLVKPAARETNTHKAKPGPRPTTQSTTSTCSTQPAVPPSRRPVAKSAVQPARQGLSPVPRYNRATALREKSLRDSGRTKQNSNGSRKRDLGGNDEDSALESLKSRCLKVKGLDPKLVETILNEVVPKSLTGINFKDVSGQNKAKAALHEMVVLPALRPELFTGLRSPAKGLLLFGPPGNGKTLLARALATEAACHLVNISSSTLTSKWVGEGEKLVKTLFSVARAIQPAIIFIDEIDALLSERKTGEHEAMRRMKTEFLLQFEGMLTGTNERLVVVAATNRPRELDDAALRRFPKRVYVRMPDTETRGALVSALMMKNGTPLSPKDMEKVASMTQGYTCSDLTNLARDAAMAPLREISTAELTKIQPENMRKIGIRDFERSSERVRRTLGSESLADFEKWNNEFGDIS